jgi:hypothetical protein
VALAGTAIDLAVGVWYIWRVISKSIPNELNGSEAGKAWPQAIAGRVLGFMEVPRGSLRSGNDPGQEDDGEKKRLIAGIEGGVS